MYCDTVDYYLIFTPTKLFCQSLPQFYYLHPKKNCAKVYQYYLCQTFPLIIAPYKISVPQFTTMILSMNILCATI